jgi:hypothetical protein
MDWVVLVFFGNVFGLELLLIFVLLLFIHSTVCHYCYIVVP